MKDIEDRVTVIISGVLATSTQFSSYISVPFVPDEVEIKSLTWNAGVSTMMVGLISTDLINGQYNNVILALPTQFTTIVPLCLNFPVKKTVLGNYRFWLTDAAGVATNTATGQLAITLEFKKYKSH